MTSAARTSISALPRGHEFTPVTLTISAEQVRRYLDATGDSGKYRNAIPPLAIVAFALRSLQEQISLPDGALHTGQEVTHQGIARAGEQLTMTGRVAMRSERQGMVMTALDFEVAAASQPILQARTTILAPGA